MQVHLSDFETEVTLSDTQWNRGIQQITVRGRGIPFLMPALSGHHFFTGVWPPPPNAVDYEPHIAPGSLTQLTQSSARWHQPKTPYTKVEISIEYEIIAPGAIDVRFETRSHANTYPYNYVGLFWGTIPAPGGQRGMHLVVPGREGKLRWHYFQGGGDNLACHANTVLGAHMNSSLRHPAHLPTYFFAESNLRFALPIQVGRWQDLFYCLEVDTLDVAFTDVLMGTAIGGPSWDLYWRLQPGETSRIHCRLTIGVWSGWETIEERHRTWPGCVEPTFRIEPRRDATYQIFTPPDSFAPASDSGLALSEKLFFAKGKPLLADLGLLNLCSVGCFGGTSQNAGVDDMHSRDHIWGPYLTFLLPTGQWERHHAQLEQSVQKMTDEVDGVKWIGYGSSEPRKTAVWNMISFLQMLTGYEKRPITNQDWSLHLDDASFLGRRWTERLFDAGQGRVFHDPNKQFVQLYRHWTGYVPPDIHKALLARSLFRTWNAGPEYNLRRLHLRGNRLAMQLYLAQFVNEVLELAFCWNEQYVPILKWRYTHFRRLPICPDGVRQSVETLAITSNHEACLSIAMTIVQSIKMLMKDLYHLGPKITEPLATFAHAVHNAIEDDEVRQQTALDW